ncbi:hypothetical protein PIB30_019966, partial [Stylosanthes scabra]|nr:hypothetical protein [Stylosanthes scabra]
SSSHIENIRQNSENTRQEFVNQNANGGNGGNSHNSHPRIMQPPFNPPVTADWSPYRMPPNFTQPVLHSNFGNNSNSAFQFGSFPNSSGQFFLEMNRSVGTSSSSSSLSIQTVKQLIEDSHLDLVNLLIQHMRTILNSIIADSNSKYDRLARQVEQVARLVYVDENVQNQNNEENNVDGVHVKNNDNDETHQIRNNIRIVQRNEDAGQILNEVRNMNQIEQ